MQRILSVLEHYTPDVILLQEVAQGIPRLGRIDQVAALKKATGLHSAFHPEHQFRRGGYGNLILSRFPLRDTRHIDLTVGWRKRRGALLSHIDVASSRGTLRVQIGNLHLGLAGSERAIQLQRLLETSAIRRDHSQASVLGGDLNDLWGTLGPRFLQPAGYQRMGRLQHTFPAALPLRPLDGLFCRGPLHPKRCRAGGTRDARQASDHLLLFADLDCG